MCSQSSCINNENLQFQQIFASSAQQLSWLQGRCMKRDATRPLQSVFLTINRQTLKEQQIFPNIIFSPLGLLGQGSSFHAKKSYKNMKYQCWNMNNKSSALDSKFKIPILHNKNNIRVCTKTPSQKLFHYWLLFRDSAKQINRLASTTGSQINVWDWFGRWVISLSILPPSR